MASQRCAVRTSLRRNFEESRQADTFQNYVIRAERRDDLRTHLAQRGIETLVHWKKPLWEHKALGLADRNLENTKRTCDEVLSLPMSAETTADEAAIVVEAIREFCFSANPNRRASAVNAATV